MSNEIGNTSNYFPFAHVIPGGTNCIVTPYTDGYVMGPKLKVLHTSTEPQIKENYNAGPPSLSGSVRYPWNTGTCDSCMCRPQPWRGVL
jgi:hypothetical protein